MVPESGDPWAALSWLQLLSLSTEKGQVAFGASVGVVSFLATLVTGDLLQRPGSPVACAAVLTLHDPDDLRGSLCRRLRLLWQWGLLGGSHRQFKSRVHEFTGGPLWAESHEVIHTDDSPCVPVPAQGTMLAEATVIPRAVLDLGLRVDVQEGALLVAALPELGVEVALRHLGHVVLVQELTLVPLLAQPPQPVLTHNRLLATDMAEWAHAPFATGSFQKEFADSSP